MNPTIFKELYSAIINGDTELMANVFSKCPAALQWNTPLGTWLHIASFYGQLEAIKILHSFGLDLNQLGGPANGNALNIAALEGKIDVALWLLDNGAIMETDEPERNPLFSAIQGGHIEIVKLLINYGINWRVSYTGQSMKNMDAHAFAIERGQSQIANYLSKQAK